MNVCGPINMYENDLGKVLKINPFVGYKLKKRVIYYKKRLYLSKTDKIVSIDFPFELV